MTDAELLAGLASYEDPQVTAAFAALEAADAAATKPRPGRLKPGTLVLVVLVLAVLPALAVWALSPAG